jgi:hypothetical protein
VPGKRARIWLGGGHPVHLGHAQVHQHHVGREALHHADRLGAGGRLAGHLEVGRALEHVAQAVADHRVVVGDQQPDGHRTSSASSGATTGGASATGSAGTAPASGRLTAMVVPLPGEVSTASWPPSSRTRSSITFSP